MYTMLSTTQVLAHMISYYSTKKLAHTAIVDCTHVGSATAFHKNLVTLHGRNLTNQEKIEN